MLWRSNGQALDCIVSNLSTKPATVTVTFFDFLGNTENSSGDSCNGFPLAAGTTCGFQLAANAGGRCVVATTGTIRAAINVLAPTTLAVVTVVEATK
jgi:hypothetical protein